MSKRAKKKAKRKAAKYRKKWHVRNLLGQNKTSCKLKQLAGWSCGKATLEKEKLSYRGFMNEEETS